MSELSEWLAGLSGAERECDAAVSIILENWRPSITAKEVMSVVRCDDLRCEACGGLANAATVPHYTSDLSAVISEIERRGWNWSVVRRELTDYAARVWLPKGVWHGYHGTTACLALLRALVAAVEAERAHVPT